MAGKSGLRSGLTSYGDDEFSLYLRTSFIKGAGYTDESLNRNIVGIINTHSDFNPCHANVPGLIESVKRGVLLNGGLPMVFPTISLHESFAHPTSMYLRNLMAIDTEETIKAQPMDSVVLIGGCDKTVPAQMMGALSAGKPFIHLVTGPMLTGSHKGVRVGACSDCRRYWAKYRAGEINELEIEQLTDQLVPGTGTCGVMGTASTMACLAEAMGLMPVGSATAPAVSANRLRIAERTGAIAVEMAKTERSPHNFLTKQNFENAIVVLQALGGSTNAIIHLLAIARRTNIEITLDDIDRIGQKTPLLVDLKPSGLKYMEDFDKAGGMPILLHKLLPLLHLDSPTVTGLTLGRELAGIQDFSQSVVRDLQESIQQNSSLVVLKGNLAPNGAVLKASAATKTFLQHSARAVVFESVADMAERIDSDDLEVDPKSILILKNIGAMGAPGMPEAGMIPIPRKLAKNGVLDMIRASDGRMSGTASGTVILHISPEAALQKSAFAIVQSGDIVTLDVKKRIFQVEISEQAIKQRLSKLLPLPIPKRGWERLYHNHVVGPEQGCDLDFLQAGT